MAKRSSKPGFGAAVFAVVVIAAGFAGLLYWRSHKADFVDFGTIGVAATPQPEAPAKATAAATTEAAPSRPASAQQVQIAGDSVVYYWPAADYVHFEFDVASDESPLIDVDFNQNGRVDARIDRSYGLDSNGAFCAVYFLREGGVSHCGDAASVGFTDVTDRGERRTIAFVLPQRELSADRTTAHLAFGLCHRGGGCEHFPAGASGFAKSYMIPIR